MANEPLRILVVDDEESFREALDSSLRREGFIVYTAADGPSGLAAFEAVSPDIVLLDVMLPGMSGIDVCRAIRRTSATPVIMVSARSDEIDTVIGLEVGADDYVTKPYRFRELVARIRTVVRRNDSGLPEDPASSNGVLVVGDIELDRERHEVSKAGNAVELTPKEFDVLCMLMDNVGHLVLRQSMLNDVWGYDYVGGGKTLDVHIKRVRAKIEDDPAAPTLIQTVRGLGYKMLLPAE